MTRNMARRDLLAAAVASWVGPSLSGWLPKLAAAGHSNGRPKKSCILLWMAGGPSQIDTFDPKPDHANGGPFRPIQTSATGIEISEHLPQLARHTHHMAVIRSMQTREGDHGRATYLLRTGYLPQGPVRYPALGSLMNKELAASEVALPGYVSILPFRLFSQGAYGPGFLGPRWAPLIVGEDRGRGGDDDPDNVLKVANLQPPEHVQRAQQDQRLSLKETLNARFAVGRRDPVAESQQSAYHQAVRMMRSSAVQAFDLSQEDDNLRDAYDRTRFGLGCLLARRLVERGVPFVEVSLNSVTGGGPGWDTHQNNFDRVRTLSEALDPAWATLLEDLQVRGLLEDTLVVWMGEFGRTPRINGSTGRDHFPAAWSTVLCGGGLTPGQIVGRTSADGMLVEDRPVSVPDLMTTIWKLVGIDPEKQNMSNVGRPIRLADPDGQVIEELAG